jgi:hypothetical protein
LTDDLIGKRILVGLTYLDATGEEALRTQFSGTITGGGGDDEVLAVRRDDTGEIFTLPPGLESAPPGEYRLHSTGEVVVDPDYLATWTIKPPAEDAE